MSEVDKFEFKNLLQLDTDCFRDNRKHRHSLAEYKQLILELYETVSSLNKKLEDSDKALTTERALRVKLEAQAANSSSSSIDLEKKLENEEEKVQNLSKRLSDAAKEIEAKNKIIDELQMTNSQASNQNNLLLVRTKELEVALSKKQEKILTMEESITLLLGQNQQLKLRLAEKEDQTEWEIKQLKQLNQEIKNKFEEVQFPSPPKARECTEEYPRFGGRSSQKHRCHSTQKKMRRNNGFLSSNSQFRKESHNLSTQMRGTAKGRTLPQQYSVNPEISEQFLNIKAEIANQYNLLNLKKENYSKERVNNTLSQLQQKMKKMLQHAEESDLQSCLE